MSRQSPERSPKTISARNVDLSPSTWDGSFSHERFPILYFTSGPSPSEETCHAPRVTSRNNKIARSASSGYSASPSHPFPIPRGGEHPCTPASISRQPRKVVQVGGRGSRLPHLLVHFSNRKSDPAGSPSFRGNPPHSSPNQFSLSFSFPRFREPIREIKQGGRLFPQPAATRSCRRKIIYKRQNSAGQTPHDHLRKVVGA